MLSGALMVMGLSAFPATATAHAEHVVCHYSYGGETKELVAEPTSSPYTVHGIAVGSYFQFRVVFRNKPVDSASVKVYVYASRNEGAALINQAVFPYPPSASGAKRYGFSGLHIVYEPMRDGELQYWCVMAKSPKPAKSAPAAMPDTKATR